MTKEHFLEYVQGFESGLALRLEFRDQQRGLAFKIGYEYGSGFTRDQVLTEDDFFETGLELLLNALSDN